MAGDVEVIRDDTINEVRPLRVLVKAIILYVLANMAFAYFNPPVGTLSMYNWLFRGRERVPYEREVEYYPISHTIPIFEDMDAMYQSHILSQPKQPGEFRVMVLGDSSAWGFELHPEEALVGQLNSLNLKTCDDRRVVVYNAAFPLPYVMKDLLIMDKLRDYDSDMYLWMITLDAFRNRSIYTDYFLDPYAARVDDLVKKYSIKNLDTRNVAETTFQERTILGQRSKLKKMLLLQLYGFGWQATGLDYYYDDYAPLSNDQTDSLLFDVYGPSELDLDTFLFDVLGAGYQHAGDLPLLAVNEPIFIASGENSRIRYNDFYPRWAYDEYLNYLNTWMDNNGHEYVDAWDALPAAEFTDTPFHRSPAGEKMLAGLIAPEIRRLACKEEGLRYDN